MDSYYVNPATLTPPKEFKDINMELLTREAKAQFGEAYVWEVTENDVEGVKRVKFSFLPGHSAGQSACEDLVLAHDGNLQTTDQLIAAQRDIAKAAARDNLYNYRDQTPVAMFAIVIAQRFRNLQGDEDEIESQAQAVNYFTTKMIEHATLIDSSSTTEAGTLLRHAFQAVFLTFVEASEYGSNGSND
jgi:HAMP domain-containing protein